MMSLAFTNPAMWAGAIALGVPPLIHFLTRFTTRLIKFPSLIFLNAARASRSRLYRLRHIILMLLRALALAMIVAAFLKPVMSARPLIGGTGPEKHSALIIVLDTSASMGYIDEGVVGFSRARTAAEKTLAQLHSGDIANLILAGANPHASFPAPSGAIPALKRDLANAAVTLERADPQAAIDEAARQLRETGDTEKQIVCISDFQRSNWAAINFNSVPPGIGITFVSVRDAPMINAAITDISVKPASPAPGEAVDITVRVTATGSGERDLPLVLQAGEKLRTERIIHVRAGETVAENFRITANQSGLLSGELNIPDDGLAADNHRYFAIGIQDRPEVIVVSDDAHPLAPLSRILASAVNPFGDNRPGPARVRTLRGRDLSTAELSPKATLVLGSLRPLDQNAADSILRFLRPGGRALYFLGGADDSANVEMLAKKAAGDFTSPFRVTGWLETPSDDSEHAATFGSANFEHPALRIFRDNAALTDAKLFRRAATERVNGAGQVLARFQDGNIALTANVIGEGQLMIANFSPAAGASDLPRRKIFVPLLHEILRSLRPAAADAEGFSVGSSCRTVVHGVAEEAQLACIDPSGEREPASVTVQRGEALVTFPPTSLAGLHRVELAGRVCGGVAVNVDRRESDAETVPVAQMQAHAKNGGRWTEAMAAKNFNTASDFRNGRPLWHWALMFALGFFVCEQALVWKWKR